jgi:hypothetical protein
MLRADVGRADILMIQLMVAAVTDHTGQPDLWPPGPQDQWQEAPGRLHHRRRVGQR